MASYTLSEIMSQATTRAGMRDDLEQSTVSFLANEAYLEVASVYPRSMSECTAHLSVVSGEPSIALPSDVEEVISISYLSAPRGMLQQRLISDIDSGSTAQAQPRDFAYFGNSIEVWPSPNSWYSLNLRYRQAPSTLTDESAVPSMSTPWRPAVVYKLEEKIHALTGNYLAASMAQQRYLSFVGSLKNDEARRQASQHRAAVRVIYD